jgi:putative SOS response-associated peptidase YedK
MRSSKAKSDEVTARPILLHIHHYPGWRLKVVHQSVKELEQLLKTQEEELARSYHIPIPKQTDLPISYDIAPSQKVLTIRFNPETEDGNLKELLVPYPADQMRMWEISPRVNSAGER